MERLFELSGRLRRVLFLGAHADDIEIGCGATARYLIERHPGLKVCWVVFSATGVRQAEAEASAADFTKGAVASVGLHEFRDGFLPYSGGDVKEVFEGIKSFDPDLVFTHFRDDRHQDHRLVSDLTWNTFRNATILEYEIPKYDGDFGTPNLFVPVEKARAEAKLSAISRHFGSQASRDWFDDGVFWGILRLRGMESRSPSGYAEAFYVRKFVI